MDTKVKILILICIIFIVLFIVYININRNNNDITYRVVSTDLKPIININKNYRSFNPCLFTYKNDKYYLYRLYHRYDVNPIGAIKQKAETNQKPSLIYLQRPDNTTTEIKLQPFKDMPFFHSGYEDPRTIVIDDNLYIFTNCYKFKENCGMAVITVSCKDLNKTVIMPQNIKLLTPAQNERQRQKNWMPFVYKKEIYLVYSISPHRILHCNPKNGEVMEISNTVNTLPNFVRGGSNAVRYSNVYIAVCHIRRNESYTHMLYTFSKRFPFQVLQTSSEFYICKDTIIIGYPPKKFIQFVSGLHYDGVNFELTWGYDDMCSKTTIINKNIIDIMLK